MQQSGRTPFLRTWLVSPTLAVNISLIPMHVILDTGVPPGSQSHHTYAVAGATLCTNVLEWYSLFGFMSFELLDKVDRAFAYWYSVGEASERQTCSQDEMLPPVSKVAEFMSTETAGAGLYKILSVGSYRWDDIFWGWLYKCDTSRIYMTSGRHLAWFLLMVDIFNRLHSASLHITLFQVS